MPERSNEADAELAELRAKVARVEEVLELHGGWYSGLAMVRAIRTALDDEA